MRRVERIVAAPIAGEDLLVHALIAGIDPSLYCACVHMRRQAERRVAGLAPTDPIGIRALQIRIEDPFEVGPQPIEEGARFGEPRILPRADLRFGPVHVEDLRLCSLQRREVLVEVPILSFLLLVGVLVEVPSDFVEPFSRLRSRLYAADNAAA